MPGDNNNVKIPAWLATLLFSAILTLQAWQLVAIVDLKSDAAATKATLTMILKKL